MRHGIVFIGCVAALFLAAHLGANDVDCLPRHLNLSYPPLAKVARVFGDVTLTMHITDGKVTIASEAGPPLLVAPLEALLQSANFEPECGDRSLTIAVIYQLRDPGSPDHDDVINPGPGRWVVTGSPPLISDPPFTVGRRPWWKRFWGTLTNPRDFTQPAD